MKKIYIQKIIIDRCTNCPDCTQINTKEEEGTGKTYYEEYECGCGRSRKLGYQEWMYPGWEGTFTDEIPNWCPLEDYKEED